jgi:hypothetical protein
VNQLARDDVGGALIETIQHRKPIRRLVDLARDRDARSRASAHEFPIGPEMEWSA